MSRISFSPLAHTHAALLHLALEAEGLPTDDLMENGRALFELADDGHLLGFIGLEGVGVDRLIRSLVVLPGCKRQGYGGLLVAHAEALARKDGVKRLHLLTTTITDFFHSCGYRPGDRDAAPPAISGTAQFLSLCPASATYLVKDLGAA